VPAELLRLAHRAYADHHVDQHRAPKVHCFVEGALEVLRVLDKEALADEDEPMMDLFLSNE
jgi:hypothetical protein